MSIGPQKQFVKLEQCNYLTGTKSVMVSLTPPKGFVTQKVLDTPPFLVTFTGGHTRLKSNVNSYDPGAQEQISTSCPLVTAKAARKLASQIALLILLLTLLLCSYSIRFRLIARLKDVPG